MKTTLINLLLIILVALVYLDITSAFLLQVPSSFNPQYQYVSVSRQIFTGHYDRVFNHHYDDDRRNEADNYLSACPTFEYTPSDEEVKSTTVKWIQNTVIGLNLCPFAERPFKTKELSFHIVRGLDPVSIVQAVTEQLLVKRDEKGTSIVICPDFYNDDFEEYLAIIQYLEQRVMTYFELHDYVQIAPFHPQFAFDGSGDNVESYTNRSPYPMMHILRTDDVDRAVDNFLGGDPGKVWRRNKKLLGILEEKIGRLKVVQLLLGRNKKTSNTTTTITHTNINNNSHTSSNDDDTIKVIQQALKQTKNEMEKEPETEKNKFRGSWVR